jgi:hypothetical protein
MNELPQANLRRVVWDKNVYEPSDVGGSLLLPAAT